MASLRVFYKRVILSEKSAWNQSCEGPFDSQVFKMDTSVKILPALPPPQT